MRVSGLANQVTSLELLSSFRCAHKQGHVGSHNKYGTESGSGGYPTVAQEGGRELGFQNYQNEWASRPNQHPAGMVLWYVCPNMCAYKRAVQEEVCLISVFLFVPDR